MDVDRSVVVGEGKKKMEFGYLKQVQKQKVPRESIDWDMLDEQIENYVYFRTGKKINLIETTYPHTIVRRFIENLITIMSNTMDWSLKITLKALEWDYCNWNNFVHFKSFKIVSIMSFIKRLRFIRDYKYISVTNEKINYWIDYACEDEELREKIKSFF